MSISFCPNCGSRAGGKYCSNCGYTLSGEKAIPTSGLDVFGDLFKKIFKVGEAWRFFLTSLHPFRELKRFLHKEHIEFAEVLALFFQIALTMRYLSVKLHSLQQYLEQETLSNVIIENEFLYSLFVVIANGLSLLVMFVLPRSLFLPFGRKMVISITYLATIYGAIYLFGISVIVIFLNEITDDPLIAGILFLCSIFALTIFHIVVLRRVLELTWLRVAIIFTISFVISFIEGFILVFFFS